MEEPSDRLKEARQRAGYETAADAARRFGWNRFTYSSHENGQRGLTKSAAQKYATAFKISAGWLLTGENRTGRNMIPVVGIVGAGAEVFAVDDHAKGGGLAEIEAPPGCPPNAVAVEVRGDSCMPELRPGDILVYWRHLPPDDQLYKRAVVALSDGRRMVKTIMPGSKPGHYTLTSPNHAAIRDRRLDWAAPIEWIKPG